jgi:hypothetical protein
MKKNLLLMMLCCPAMLAAQNGVTVSGLAVNAGSPTTVTFNVNWQTPMPVALWSDTVWVFVDYNKNGVMERLPVTSATASAGTVTKIPGNDKGVWVAGNARSAGSFSATVRLFTTVSSVGGACAYASNYPPVGEYTATDKIEFTGTPDYKVVLERYDNSTYTATVNKNEPFLLTSGEAVLSFTDKTGAPGTLSCMPSTPYNLTVSATAYCAGSSVTFALSNTMLGQTYWLYKDSNPVNTLTGTGSAATFTGAFAGAGVYTAQAIADMGYCPVTMNGNLPVVSNLLPDVPAMGGGGSQCGGTKSITATAGSGGNGNRWTDNSSTVSSRSVGTGTYYAVTTSAAGCESGTASVAVTINTVPSAPTMGGGGSQCGGTMDITATPGSDGNGIRWTDGSGTTVTRSVGTGTYYAVTTSAAGCESGTASVAVTIRQAGTEGQAPDAICICADGLHDCSGTCKLSCGNFSVCDGFTYVQDVDALSYDAAVSACQGLGPEWRLATRAELGCMCQHESLLPEYLKRGWAIYSNNMGTWCVRFDGCYGDACTGRDWIYAKCVK